MSIMNDKSDYDLAQIIWDYMRYQKPPEEVI